MALSGHSVNTRQCPLLGVKRTSRLMVKMSATIEVAGNTYCLPACFWVWTDFVVVCFAQTTEPKQIEDAGGPNV
jgi:hypothetical protein